MPRVNFPVRVVHDILISFIHHHTTTSANMVVVNHRQFLRLHVCFDVFDSFSDEVHFEELIQSFKNCQSYLYLHHGEDYGNPYALVVVDFHVPSPVGQVSTCNIGGRLLCRPPPLCRWSLVAHRNVSNGAFRCSRVSRALVEPCGS